jgi:hypothetical protein
MSGFGGRACGLKEDRSLATTASASNNGACSGLIDRTTDLGLAASEHRNPHHDKIIGLAQPPPRIALPRARIIDNDRLTQRNRPTTLRGRVKVTLGSWSGKGRHDPGLRPNGARTLSG